MELDRLAPLSELRLLTLAQKVDAYCDRKKGST
jgi:hypothetical protein